MRKKVPRIIYPGSFLQNSYSEDLEHYWLLWDIQGKNNFSVEKKIVPNLKPFLTIAWTGDVDSTLDQLKDAKAGCRVRIKSVQKIPLQLSTRLVSYLKNELKVSEVVFKEEQQTTNDSHVSRLVNSDFRNSEKLCSLLRQHYKSSSLSEDEWKHVGTIIASYIVQLDELGPRDITWSLKRLQFNNLYSYGEGNSVNFEALSGLVGILGPNRRGKSSIPGALVYTLFNSTDRGSIKNAFVCNIRKNSCVSTALLTVNGRDYAIRRSTTKRDDDPTSGSTNLKMYEVIDGKFIENSGEQRNDTERSVRKLIGTIDDFSLMSLVAQKDNNSILDHGNTKRRHILSRFFDIDILQKIYELAREDSRKRRSLLKNVDVNYLELIAEKQASIDLVEQKLQSNLVRLDELKKDALQKRTKMLTFKDAVAVTELEIKVAVKRVSDAEKSLNDASESRAKTENELKSVQEKKVKLAELLEAYNLTEMRESLQAFRSARDLVDSLENSYIVGNNDVEATKRTLQILDDVPCGDKYPTCKFIRNAHELQPQLSIKQASVQALKAKFEVAKSKLESLDERKLEESIKKVEQLAHRNNQLDVNVSKLQFQLNALADAIQERSEKLQTRKNDLDVLKSKTADTKNVEYSELVHAVNAIDDRISRVERENMEVVMSKGKLLAELEQLTVDCDSRDSVLKDLKLYEVIEAGFSKSGLQDSMLATLLPIVNEEIANVLRGITNFTILLEKKLEDDQIDIYIDYGDGDRRILELGSGMEKFMGSIVLRLALHNVSSLPKSDVFIIDEGFGSLDASSTEECVQLLQSLKKYFKTILVISHQDAIKDAMDTTIDISTHGKDAKVVV